MALEDLEFLFFVKYDHTQKSGYPSYLPQREKGFTFIHAFVGVTCVGKTGVLDD